MFAVLQEIGLQHVNSYVNVTGVSSDSAQGTWDAAEVIFTLRAPDRPSSPSR